ncbi:MAG: hypothetical protein ACRCW0_05165 [Clostridium sp.]
MNKQVLNFLKKNEGRNFRIKEAGKSFEIGIMENVCIENNNLCFSDYAFNLKKNICYLNAETGDLLLELNCKRVYLHIQ